MPLMVSMPGNIKDEASLKAFVDKVKPDILDGGWDEYTAQLVAVAKSLNLVVWPDIQGRTESADWNAALAKGIWYGANYICTNRICRCSHR